MFDPFAKIVYDYMGGMEDIIKAKVRMYLFDFVVSYITFFLVRNLNFSIVILLNRSELWFLQLLLFKRIVVSFGS
jgi:hypothetical protein